MNQYSAPSLLAMRIKSSGPIGEQLIRDVLEHVKPGRQYRYGETNEFSDNRTADDAIDEMEAKIKELGL